MTKALLLENIHNISVGVFSQNNIDSEIISGALDEDTLIERLKGVEVLGIRSATTITEKVLNECSSLKAIGAYSIGTNQIDLKAASARGVAVFNAPFSNGRSVAELALCEIIALMRHLPERNDALHDGIWDKTAAGSYEVRGKKLGIIGYGKIGSQLSVLAESLGMSVYYYDIVERPALGNAQMVATLEELLKIVDAVSLHVDGREDNREFFKEEHFSTMKEGAVFLNLSRGFVVDYIALKKHLNSGKIAGAAIDVFEDEPKKRGDKFEHVLVGEKNVILTPHIGGSTLEAQKAIGEFVSTKLSDYYNYGATALSVNFPNIALNKTESISRIMHVHKNTPGVLTKVNNFFSSANFNIDAQWLSTKGELGYVITDLNHEVEHDIILELAKMEETLQVRQTTK